MNGTKLNSEIFAEQGYVIVRSAVDKQLADFLTQYALFDEMQDFTPEGYKPTGITVPNAHSKYADPAMETLLLNLLPTMEENTGLKLFPTYSYYRVYRNGDILKKHSDRESCEISTTICFNHSYNDEYQWPIYMDGKEVVLNPTDMVIYRGCDLDHWRNALNHDKNCWHVQGFLHYVDANGPNKEFKFDKRDSIGALRKYSPSVQTHEKSYIRFTK